MEIPNIAKGFLYPSSRVCRCPRFHRCTISNKCQNYDRHNLECAVCETRVIDPEEKLEKGGYLPEGEVYPDMQEAIHTIEQNGMLAMAHPDREAQSFNSTYIADKYARETKAANMMAEFLNTGDLTIEEKIMHALTDAETSKLLGRME